MERATCLASLAAGLLAAACDGGTSGESPSDAGSRDGSTSSSADGGTDAGAENDASEAGDVVWPTVTVTIDGVAGNPNVPTLTGQPLAMRFQWADRIAPVNGQPDRIVYYPWGPTNLYDATAWGVIGIYTPGAGSFASAGAWTTFDLTTINPLLVGYGGGRLDDYTNPHFAYLAGNANFTQGSKQVNNNLFVRADVTTDLSSAADYATFDVNAIPNAPTSAGGALANGGGQFVGQAIGGRFYFSPSYSKDGTTGAVGLNSEFLAVDLESGSSDNFVDPTHWYYEDCGSLLGATTPNDFGGFQGSVSLGTALYFVRFDDHTAMWRFDSAGPAEGALTSSGAPDPMANRANYTYFRPDLATFPNVDGSLIGGHINGGAVSDRTVTPRFVVYAPFDDARSPFPADASTNKNAIVLAYDTTNPGGGDFSNVANWAAIDLGQVAGCGGANPNCANYQGVVDDGKGFMFLVASNNGLDAGQSLVWNNGSASALSDFSDPANWRALGAASGDAIGYNCGQAFDPGSSTLYPASYGLASLTSYGNLAQMQIHY
jgi:hypothetical protein